MRELVEPLIAAGVEATVPATMRETVAAVTGLCPDAETTATVVADRQDSCDLDKSAAWRRVEAAIEHGYLVNREDKRGRPAKIALGDALPADTPILPDGCMVAVVVAGDNSPPPPPDDDPFAGESGANRVTIGGRHEHPRHLPPLWR